MVEVSSKCDRNNAKSDFEMTDKVDFGGLREST